MREHTIPAGDLGAFARDTGSPNTLAASALVLAAVAAALALVRPVVDVAGGSALRAPGRIAVLLALASIVGGLLGGYQASARGQRGTALARNALLIGLGAALLAFVYGAVRDGSIRLGDFGRAYFDLHLMRQILPDLLHGLGVTMRQAALAEGAAIGVGLIVAGGELSSRAWLRYPAVAYVDAVRGLPLLVLAFLVYFGLTFVGITLAPFVAIVTTLTINASAYCAEIFRAGIQAIPRGQTDAARSLGMPAGMTLLFVLVPQAVRAVIPPLMSEFIALVKDTSIVNAAVGFTTASADVFGAARTAAASSFSVTPYMLAAGFYLIVTVPLARLVGRLERRLRLGVV